MRILSRANAALTRVGVLITAGVGTMWTAVVFAVVAIIATPGVLPLYVTVVAQWLAQDFFQLILLPVIMVGQAVAQAALERVIREIHDDLKEDLAITHSALSAAQEALEKVTAIADSLHVHLTGESHPSVKE